MNKTVKFNIIGGGLAGCEAANYIANKGYKVNLYEMKPDYYTPAHKSSNLAELVCSNSLKSKLNTNANGLLKDEMSLLGSIILKNARLTEIPGGKALTVDRDAFSSLITKEISENENISVINQKVDSIEEILAKDEDSYVIVSSGPLTTDELFNDLNEITGSEDLYFYDAVAPSIEYEDIDFTNAYLASRYDQDDSSYINCPLTKDEYHAFYNFLINAKTAQLKDFENKKVFEACMPVEVLAKRGYDALRFGPMRPVGLINKHTNERDFAVIQLRQENKLATIYNLVGFQTNLTFKMQDQLMSYIPALRNCKIIRYGVMHRNTYINAPNHLNKYFQLKKDKRIFFAGQITGVEGYVPSAASGLLASINAVREYENKEKIDFTRKTVLGALQNHISIKPNKEYLPMNANFGILQDLEVRMRNKQAKYEAMYKRSMDTMEELLKDI